MERLSVIECLLTFQSLFPFTCLVVSLFEEVAPSYLNTKRKLSLEHFKTFLILCFDTFFKTFWSYYHDRI